MKRTVTNPTLSWKSMRWLYLQKQLSMKTESLSEWRVDEPTKYNKPIITHSIPSSIPWKLSTFDSENQLTPIQHTLEQHALTPHPYWYW
jgi:hypothetical protein